MSQKHRRSELEGCFEPFGTDHQAGTPDGASESGVFLRLPGQWDDEVWEEASLGGGLYYNVHRWYASAMGRYSSADPLGLRGGANLLAYVDNRPSVLSDHLGLAYFAKRPVFGLPWIPVLSCNPLDDFLDPEISHQQLFFEDGQEPSNTGIFGPQDPSGFKWRCKDPGYNDCIMRMAV